MKDKPTFSFARVHAMPSADTFSIKPIGDFVRRYLDKAEVSVDPFARNFPGATYRNDLDPNTAAQYHMDAVAFLLWLKEWRIMANLLIFDPPYSPRQISECYKSVGIAVGIQETQNAKLYKRVRDAAMDVLATDAIVLSFGWNTVGMGIGRGFEVIDFLDVCHGGAHNDTLCIAERRLTPTNPNL